MRILVIAGRFGISGVPLAQMRLARALASKGHDVDLVYGMVNEGHDAPVVPGVRVLSWDKPRVSQMVLPLRRYFLDVRPDIVFSAGDHLNVMVLIAAILSGSPAKISCSSRVTPFDTYSRTPFTKGWILRIMSQVTMWRADVLTCVSADMVDQYRTWFRGSRHVCAYNIVDDDYSRRRMGIPAEDEWLEKPDAPVLVAAGSLEPWKGFEDLVRAMALVNKTVETRLIILGEGPLRARLGALITELGMQNRIKLRGNVENPLSYFSCADVFVLSSYVEGLPNVLVEAMLCGCTPVATNCPTGPREVLQDGRYGYLVAMRDPVALAEGILKAIERPIPKGELLHAIEQFSETNVISRHYALLGLPPAPSPASCPPEVR